MRRLAILVLLTLPVEATEAQTVPTIDTESATLRSQRVQRGGWLHPAIDVDVRNGDLARGDYDGALIHDERLRRLSGPDGETGTVVPIGTPSLSPGF